MRTETPACGEAAMRVKICGLTDVWAVRDAAALGAAYVGLVLFPGSPRHLSLETAGALAVAVPRGVTAVALLVDPDDGLVERAAALPIGMLQLHGRETPARTAEIRARTRLPVMKAVGIGGADDLAQIAAYEAVADQILLDARAPEGAGRPGGNAAVFDWRLIAGRAWARPWMLAGGLTPGNVADAVRLTGARQVDVSSGVERAPGRKDPGRIAAFLAAARAAADRGQDFAGDQCRSPDHGALSGKDLRVRSPDGA
jgi:phosphoribosylanthranilate isomerase